MSPAKQGVQSARKQTARKKAAKRRLRLRQTRSFVGYRRDQRATLRGLGLRRMGAVADLEDTPAVRGMIRKVSHLLSVEELD